MPDSTRLKLSQIFNFKTVVVNFILWFVSAVAWRTIINRGKLAQLDRFLTSGI